MIGFLGKLPIMELSRDAARHLFLLVRIRVPDIGGSGRYPNSAARSSLQRLGELQKLWAELVAGRMTRRTVFGKACMNYTSPCEKLVATWTAFLAALAGGCVGCCSARRDGA